jgi:hypothetical protein
MYIHTTYSKGVEGVCEEVIYVQKRVGSSEHKRKETERAVWGRAREWRELIESENNNCLEVEMS